MKQLKDLPEAEQRELVWQHHIGGLVEIGARGEWRPAAYNDRLYGDIICRLALTKPSIDWSHVHKDYDWLAVDADGRGYLYVSEPLIGEIDWELGETAELVFAGVLASYIPGTCDWKDSLVQRPED